MVALVFAAPMLSLAGRAAAWVEWLGFGVAVAFAALFSLTYPPEGTRRSAPVATGGPAPSTEARVDTAAERGPGSTGPPPVAEPAPPSAAELGAPPVAEQSPPPATGRSR